MAEHNAEYMRFKVVNDAGHARDEHRRDCRIITLDKIYDWIEKRGYDEAVNVELKKMVSKYPHNAFSSFGKNFEKHLLEAQQLAMKNRPMFVGELGDDNYKRVESIGDGLVSPSGRGNIKELPKVGSVRNDFDDMEMPEKISGKSESESKPEQDLPCGIVEITENH